MARASKDPQGNVQNDTNTLRPIAGSPWRAGSHSVSRKSGRWIYQHDFSFTPMPLAPHAANSRLRYMHSLPGDSELLNLKSAFYNQKSPD
jgi:hypothetical protein